MPAYVFRGDNVSTPPANLSFMFFTIEGTTTTNRTAFQIVMVFSANRTLTLIRARVPSIALVATPYPDLLFPPGLPFRVALTVGIDTATAACRRFP